MNYQETLAYLDSLGKFGIRLGMERIEGLLRELGNPERKIKTIHVTGTNGKGSVSSMIANILLAADLKTGKFTSPHLVKYNERLVINGQDIDDYSFAVLITIVKKAADSVVAKGICEQPTQFEVLTAAAFMYFALENVDYAVIEVGMGGLWDSTNVIIPVVSVITNVSLDHTDRCGATVERIAMQKAGIIKENVPVVTAADGEDIGLIMQMFMQKRRASQPLEYPSAGSTFKRPEGYFAGKLIDDAGLRGYKVGGAMVSEKHCGFVINYDNATATDVINLMKDVQAKVKEKFDVQLEPEVRII